MFSLYGQTICTGLFFNENIFPCLTLPPATGRALIQSSLVKFFVFWSVCITYESADISFLSLLVAWICFCSPNKAEFIRAKYQMLAFVHRLPCREDDSVTAKDLSKVSGSWDSTGKSHWLPLVAFGLIVSGFLHYHINQESLTSTWSHFLWLSLEVMIKRH